MRVAPVLALLLATAATSACTNAALGCLLCTTALTAGGMSEDDPLSVREWPTALGTVRETSWSPFSFPDTSFECLYVLIDESGGMTTLAHLSVEVHSCQARRAPTVDEGGHLVVPSAAAFVVWSRSWPRAREVMFNRMTYRHRVLATLEPTLHMDGNTWTIRVSGTDAFVSADGGTTWRGAHADARLD